ncbi:Glyoxylate/hydroxypyruvate reductase A [Roseobacter fucihabitans]|uniref:Glyoxylate/hydroxypyruvate reductase A n=1 Tax=Roseobacter fucihabitans TaxID=1537242 RepID=A0ABZ2BX15_9RHOB|nr:glyoxylate/hydroxypyruvate reductase A [Roseobacter litoralis]MBC6964533.1 Glyoxylate/hydroxypyruvate reductase A [Roseobacter litoralis]
MSLNVLFAAHADRWGAYRAPLQDAFSALDLDVNLALDLPPAEVDYIIYAPNSPLQDFAPYTRAKAVLNLWAGVEGVTKNTTLTIPLARMVDPGMTKSMTEWVAGHVMRYHLGMDRHIVNPDHIWAPHTPPLASERSVCILGMGELGGAVAQVLGMLDFKLSGWSRRAKSVDGVVMHHGDMGLKDALSNAQIVVLLLPDTAQTENILNAESLGWLPKGAFIINPGRGPLIEDQALLEALDSGQVAQATLDVFRVEPLPQDHPFWTDPRVTVTPHIAAETREHTASQVIAQNVWRGEAGEPFLYLVDRDSGY